MGARIMRSIRSIREEAMRTTAQSASLRRHHHAAHRSRRTLTLGLVTLAAALTMPAAAAAQLLQGPIAAAPVFPGPPGFASKAPIQSIVTLTCDGIVCHGDTPTTGVGQTLEVLFVSCGINTERVDDFLGASVVVLQGDNAIAGHFLGSTPPHPSRRFSFISQPILLTVPPGHFLRFTAQSLGGPILSATCSMSAKR
jgi:hypothetical protein